MFQRKKAYEKSSVEVDPMDNMHDEETANDQVLESGEEKQAKPKEHKLGVLSKRTSSQMNSG